MCDSVRIISFPQYKKSIKNQETYCNFVIEEKCITFTDEIINISEYLSIEIANYEMCRKQYQTMCKENYIVFIELKIKEINGWILSHFYFEATKDKCEEIANKVTSYIEKGGNVIK